jgi:hypothetical protein
VVQLRERLLVQLRLRVLPRVRLPAATWYDRLLNPLRQANPHIYE